MACPAGTFLPPGLDSTSRNFRPGLGLMGSQAGIGLLPQERLMHQIRLDLNLEDRLRQFGGVHFLAPHVEHVYLHLVSSAPPFRPIRKPRVGSCFRRSLITTTSPVAPGTLPRTPNRLRSGSTRS